MARFAFLVCVVAAASACRSKPSAFDRTAAGRPSPAANSEPVDPWNTPSKPSDGDGSASGGLGGALGGGLGGFDLQGTLTKIKDSIQKPGPYEAAETSPSFDATHPHWGVMNLRGAIVERQAWSITGGKGTELREVVGRLRDLAKDKTLTGVLLRLDGVAISMPDAVELRAVMHDFRNAGKKLYCHAENAPTGTYLVAAACERFGLAPLGEVMIPGPAAMPIHIKGLLDKLGITADFLHVGAFKGAAEPLTRDAPSPEMLTTLGDILDRRYQTTVDIISRDRKLEPAAVKDLIDTAMFAAPAARTAKLVDDVMPFEGFRDANTSPWTKLDLDADKANALEAALKLARFVGAMPPEKPFGPHVTVVYAVGNIVDGGGEGVLGARGEIASHTLVAALHAIAIDDSVKAVVLRVDSGGGSAQASELIWTAVQELKARKPVIVSMSDVAASGGYYISSGATKIFALDDTLTGSIGVVGGKIAPGGALDKLGVTTFPMGRGKRATMWASLGPWNADEKDAIQKSMDAVYEVFVGRVAEGRGKKVEDVKKMAEGRVWVGTKAKELGLVDEIGGLDAALAEARRLGGNLETTTPIEVYPGSPTLRDVLHGYGQVQSPLGLSTSAALDMLDPETARAAEQLLSLVMSFQQTQIQAVSMMPVLR